MQERQIMSQDDVRRALTRVAHEILENNRGADDLVIVGIHTRGVHLARRIADYLAKFEGVNVPVGSLDISLYRDDLDRGHRELPIRADYVGQNLPTAIDERVKVRLLETDGADEVALVFGDFADQDGSGNSQTDGGN